MAFSSLLYTECSPDRSVHGREGLQFQAESPDATPEMEQAVVAHLLYRPSAKLMATDAPVEAFPLSFSYHRIRGHHYLGVGRYVGQDSHGRKGNQLTHCLVTEDPEDIRPSRPAQLFRSGAWLTSASDSVRLPSVAAPLRIADAYQPTALHAMATARQGIVEFLPKLLTAFEEAAGAHRKKLVVSATDVELAVRWIALGGLFLDPADVLDLSFRIFTESPLAEDLSIAVFNPELIRSAPAIETLPPAVNGIDLQSLRTSPITPSPSAVTYSRWFLEHDAFDSLEAIELGRRWQPHLASPAVATLMTGIACLGHSAGPGTGAVTIAAALSAVSEHEPDDIDEYGGALAEAILTIRPAAGDDPAALHQAALTLRRNKHHDAAETLTLALLEGTCLYPDTYGVRWSEAARTADPAEVSRARWTSSDAKERAAQLLSETLQAARDASLASLFTLIPALALGLRWPAVQGPGQRLAEFWSSHPDAIADRAHTAFYPELEALLFDVLEARLRNGDEAVQQAMRAGRWNRLQARIGHYSACSAVVAALTAAAVAAAPHPERLGILRDYLGTARAPEWTLFFPAGRRADAELLGVWISAHPATLRDRSFADLVSAAIDEELTQGGRALLDRIGRLTELPPELSAVAAKHVRAEQLLRQLREHREETPNPVLEDLVNDGIRFHRYYASNLADCLIWQYDVAGVSRYLSATRPYHLQDDFYRCTIVRLQNNLPDFAHQLMYVCRSLDTLSWMRNELLNAFTTWVRKDDNRKRAMDAARYIDRQLQADWYEFVEEMFTDKSAGLPPPPRKLPSIRIFRKGSR